MISVVSFVGMSAFRTIHVNAIFPVRSVAAVGGEFLENLPLNFVIKPQPNDGPGRMHDMGRAASRYVASPTSERRSADTSPTLLRSGASRPFITGTYNGCVYYPLRAARPKTRDRAPSLCPRSTLNSFLSRIRITMASATPQRNVLATMWRGVGQSGLGPTIFGSLRVKHAHSGRPPPPGKPSGTLARAVRLAQKRSASGPY